MNLFALDLRLLHSPIKTIQSFKADFMMVLNCHRERTFMMSKQPHLTWWQLIAVPLDKWIAYTNPPFGYLPAALGPLGLFPLFFKFYDALSGFNCPPSHIMKPSRGKCILCHLSKSVVSLTPLLPRLPSPPLSSPLLPSPQQLTESFHS